MSVALVKGEGWSGGEMGDEGKGDPREGRSAIRLYMPRADREGERRVVQNPIDLAPRDKVTCVAGAGSTSGRRELYRSFRQ